MKKKQMNLIIKKLKSSKYQKIKLKKKFYLLIVRYLNLMKIKFKNNQ